ncbi:MAG TPA: glutaminyl-peptide cyclotransferase [Candidatus Agrococcus pullicola]|uniref:Glutaminyl-peptide cyclotransferase n=1 Tax=Candidatus Agrococcus pullicola TaxID=2838429 RepID=A0A9D1YUP4_9MICO|nr:glutaminyl-peptide cyclotransferase [Candidatus Agrococcus pullicola]
MRVWTLLLIAVLPFGVVACASESDERPEGSESAPSGDHRSAPVEATFALEDATRIEDRSPELFTQGLEFGDDGSLFHSGGRYGESRVVKTDASGAVMAEHELSDEYFAEGLTIVGDELYLLTWRENVVQVLSTDDLTERRTYSLSTEGWGTCYSDAGVLWVSDGTDEVRGYNPADMSEQTSLTIADSDGDAIENINELECIDGEIWANLWQEERIIVFDEDTGEIVRMLDFSDLTPDRAGRDEVLNGIAFHADADEIWLTGKRWEHFFVFDYAELRCSQ